jgi:hypothetical protein
MLIRAIALCVALLVGVGIMLPMMTDSSEAGPKYSRKNKKKRSWNVKKYSKKWWSLYRRQEKRKRAMVARRRALRARQILLERQNNQAGNTQEMNATYEKTSAQQTQVSVRDESAILPSGEKAPQTWKTAQTTSGELQYRVTDESGIPMGSASLTVVGTATGADSDSVRNKTIGGVSTNALRRTVIDKMMREEGFVVNDYQKDVNGKKVYVVVAQTTIGGAPQSKLFYFTEVDGRIYSLATSAPVNSQERLAQESERVINSLQRNNRSVQAGLK